MAALAIARQDMPRGCRRCTPCDLPLCLFMLDDRIILTLSRGADTMHCAAPAAPPAIATIHRGVKEGSDFKGTSDSEMGVVSSFV